MKGILSHKILFFLLRYPPVLLLGANDLCGLESSSGSYTSTEFWAAENWTTGTRSTADTISHTTHRNLTGIYDVQRFFLVTASTDGSRVLNSNSGPGRSPFQGDASFRPSARIQWGNTQKFRLRKPYGHEV